jgi:hypothetical protein
MEEIYNYIAEQLQAPEAVMGQFNRIADAIETLDTFPERVKLMETEEERALGECSIVKNSNWSILIAAAQAEINYPRK